MFAAGEEERVYVAYVSALNLSKEMMKTCENHKKRQNLKYKTNLDRKLCDFSETMSVRFM